MKKRIVALVMCVMMLMGIVQVQPVSASTDTTKKKQVIAMAGYMETDKAIETKVTRAQFAQILYNLTEENPDVTEEVNVSLYSDVSKKHWAAAYIKAAVENGYMQGYLNGKFKPGKYITLQEAAYALLKVLGYSDTDFTNGLSASVMTLYKQKKLNTDISLTKTSKLTKNSCALLLYNLLITTNTQGVVYGTTKDFTLDKDGEIDYLTYVDSYTEGPVVLSTDYQTTYTNKKFTSIYLNEEKVTYSDLDVYDVIYYNETLKTIWAYDGKVTGTVKAISPSKAAPTSVTIGSTSYELGTQEMITKFSSLGSIEIGDTVTLLLGKDNEVAGALSVNSYSVSSYGYVESIDAETEINDDVISTVIYVTVMDFSGSEQKIEYSGDVTDFEEGDIASLTYTATGIQLKKLTYSSKGTQDISEDGKTIGDIEISNQVKILETTATGFETVSLDRLKGCRLTSANVYFEAFDEDGRLVALMLNDYTHDSDTYAVVTDLTIGSNNSATVTYLEDGVSTTITSSSVYPSSVPSRIVISKNAITLAQALNVYRIQEISTSEMVDTAGTIHKYTEDLQVYYYNSTSQTYTYTNLASVSDLSKYRLMAYYDNTLQNGGMVRILIAYKLS